MSLPPSALIPMSCVRRRVFSALLALLLLCGAGGVLLAAPPAPPPPTNAGAMVYGLIGLLAPAEDEPANTLLYTSDAIHPVVGATPALDERLRWLSGQEPPAKVKVWGRWVGAAGPTRQLVVTGLLLLHAEQAMNRALAVGEAAPVTIHSLLLRICLRQMRLSLATKGLPHDKPFVARERRG